MSKLEKIAIFAAAILGTGAFLNLAGSGKLGVTAQRAAKYVTTGYGI